jgi:iron complex transport system ATP-binding protein
MGRREPSPFSDARYLLLDEPTASLDLSHQHQTLGLARRFAREGAGVLVILHDLNLAAQYADRIVVLKEGRQLAEGTPPAVLTPEVIEVAFSLPVLVTGHPRLDCPLIVPLGGSMEAGRSPGEPMRSVTRREQEGGREPRKQMERSSP